MTMVKRYDYSGELAKPVKTPEGWLEVEGIITRTGVFKYRNADGSERLELRLPEEVFHVDSLKSFGLRPVTDDHPPEFLDSTNTRTYAVGAVSESITRDGKFVRAKMLVTDATAVHHLESKKKLQLSGGYVCELEFKPGEHDGEKYDCIQRKIRGNHVALVEAGRAGPSASVRMDASDAVMISTGSEGAPPNREQVKTMGTKTIRHDGVSYELSEQGAELVEKLRTDAAAQATKFEAEAKAAKDAASAIQAKLDTAAEELEKEKQAHADAVKPEKLRALIDARVELETKARAHLDADEKLASMTEDEIKRALIKTAYPERKLDGKDASYVQAMYELSCEKLDGDETEETAPKNKLAAARKAARADAEDDEEHEDGEDDLDPVAAEARMKKANRDAYKVKPARS